MNTFITTFMLVAGGGIALLTIPMIPYLLSAASAESDEEADHFGTPPTIAFICVIIAAFIVALLRTFIR